MLCFILVLAHRMVTDRLRVGSRCSGSRQARVVRLRVTLGSGQLGSGFIEAEGFGSGLGSGLV